jgi:hypothetical protein
MAIVSRKGALIAFAVAGMFGCAGSQIPAGSTPRAAAEPVRCGGINACKAQGACAGNENACKATNDCKGKGWVEAADAADCKAKGGNVWEAHS